MLRRHQGKLLEVVEGIFSDEKTYSPSCQQGTKVRRQLKNNILLINGMLGE